METLDPNLMPLGKAAGLVLARIRSRTREESLSSRQRDEAQILVFHVKQDRRRPQHAGGQKGELIDLLPRIQDLQSRERFRACRSRKTIEIKDRDL